MHNVKGFIKRLKKRARMTGARTGSINVPELFRKTHKLRIDRFLSKLGDNSHLIAPDELLNHVRSLRWRTKFSSSCAYDGTVNGRTTVLVLMPEELQCVGQIRADHPDCSVFSVKYDVLPALISHRKTQALDRHGFEPVPDHKYAVFCTPRSGSTYLCRLLAQAGYGHPIEHLHEPLVYFVSLGLDFSRFLNNLYRVSSNNSIFGTKFIDHFVFTAFASGEAQKSFCNLLTDEGFKLLCLERDKVEQAVSQYFAVNTEVWHLAADTQGARPEKHNILPYDFEKLKTHYDSLINCEIQLQEFLQKFHQPILHIDYAELDARPQETLGRVLDFLDFSEVGQKGNSAYLTRKLSAEMSVMKTYVSRFRKDLEHMS